MTEENIKNNRKRIYEKIDFLPVPENYNSKIPWSVQNQIAATNGVHYINRIGKLNEFPIFELPVKRVSGNKLMLDIGSGWGRWLIGGFNKGYIPIGIDIRLEFCQTQQKVLKSLNKKGYSVVADLENIPFLPSTFDLVWSFSVIQHTHAIRLKNCLTCIDSILTKNGITKLEFPNSHGIRNRFGPAIKEKELADDFDSWCVRYYSPLEYEKIIENYLCNFHFTTHSFLGIGVLKEDLKYVSNKHFLQVAISLLLTSISKVLPFSKYLADSVYITAKKKNTFSENTQLNNFINTHTVGNFDNLNVIKLLKCPISGNEVEMSPDRKKIISKTIGIYYPIEDNIPIMISSEARNL